MQACAMAGTSPVAYTSEPNRTEPCQHGYDNRAIVARFGTVQHGTAMFTLLSQSEPNRGGTVSGASVNAVLVYNDQYAIFAPDVEAVTAEVLAWVLRSNKRQYILHL